MSKYRKYSKRKKYNITKRKKHSVIKTYNVTPKERIDFNYDKIAEAIVKANNIQAENDLHNRAKELDEWRKSIGIKTYDDKKGIIKIFSLFANRIRVILGLIFFSKKKKIKVSATGAFIKSFTALFFHAIKIILWIISAIFIGIIFHHPNISFTAIHIICCICFATTYIILASIFRIMAIEVEQLNDRERLLGIFTAVMSVIPIVETIVSFFKGVE